MDHQAGMSRGYSNYVLFILGLGLTLSYADRQLMSVLISPIKADLGLSDSELGLLSGLAFAMFYAICAIPMARLADRHSRRNIMVAVMSVWSVVTLLGGIAQSFVHLLLVRMGVGVGEAGYTPAAYSTLADLYPPERQQFAAGLLSAGPQVGIISSLLIGGLVAPAYGWRAAFLIAGAPGLIVAALILFTVREPKRRFVRPAEAGLDMPSFPSSLASLWQTRSYRYVVVMSAFHGFSTYALTAWMPSFFERTHGMSLSLIGPALAAATICGALGSIFGGALGDRLGRRDIRYPLYAAAAAYLLCIPLILATLWLASTSTSIVVYALFLFLLTLPQGTAYAMCIRTSPDRIRALGISVLIFVVAFIGFGLGPLATGVASDLFKILAAADPLRLALTIMAASLLPPAFYAVVAAKHLLRDSPGA